MGKALDFDAARLARGLAEFAIREALACRTIAASPSTKALSVALGHAIRRRRTAAGVGLRGIAKALGSSHAIVSRVEHGVFAQSLETITKYAAALGCAPWELLADAERETHAPALRALLELDEPWEAP